MPPTNWNCIKCGVTNPKTYFKCQMCQEPKPIFWECTACKTKNPTISVKCINCRRKRPSMFATAFVKGLSNVKFTLETQQQQQQPAQPSQASGTASGIINQATSMPGDPALAPTGSTFSGITPLSTTSNVAPSAISSIVSSGGPQTSGLNSLSKNISSYDIFRKLIRPSRTVKLTQYVDNENKYQEIVTSCVQSKTPFGDKHFPASNRSLYYNPQQANKSNKVYWLRPTHIKPIDHQLKSVMDKPWRVVDDMPVADDIVQGILGNCWFISALTVLVSEKPELLNRVLATTQYSPQGCYRVRLYKDGKLTSVIVDDQFPCNSKRFLIYSCAKRKQLYVPIIEKAMAKLYGCYESLVSGQISEGLSALTGYPCRSIKTQCIQPAETLNMEEDSPVDPDFVWTILLSSHSAGFLMSAACGSAIDDQITEVEYKDRGLLSRHAYSVMNVVATNDLRLIRLRNPWGQSSWRGEWADNSQSWTAELRQSLQPTLNAEGIFWMSFGDFQRYFEKVDICKIRDGWHEYRYEGQFPISATDTRFMCVFEVNVEEPGTEIELTLHQESRRSSTLKKLPLLPICTAVFQFKDVTRNLVGDFIDFSGYKIREFIGCDVMVDKGNYMVVLYAFNHWTFSQEQKQSSKNLRPRFLLSIHTSRDVNINAHCPPAPVIGDTLIEITMTRGRKKIHTEDVHSYYMLDNWSGLLVVIENRSTDAYLEVIFDASESTNLTTTRGNLLTQDTIPPLKRQLINCLSRIDASQVYYLAYQMSYRVTNETHQCSHNPDITQIAFLHGPRQFRQCGNTAAN